MPGSTNSVPQHATALVVSAHSADFVTLERVKAERQEAEAAAARLGVSDTHFRDPGDDPISLSHEPLERLS